MQLVEIDPGFEAANKVVLLDLVLYDGMVREARWFGGSGGTGGTFQNLLG